MMDASKKGQLWVQWIMVMILFAACGSDNGETIQAPEEPVFIRVDPAETDPAISSAHGKNYAAFNPSVSSKYKLFVFLPGTSAIPGYYRFIVRAAADNGFYAIGLAYPNDSTVYDLCSGSDDVSACTLQVHEEILTGQGGPGDYDISAADSIENRLVKMLLYLSDHYPGTGWDRFLDDDNAIIWEAVRLAGHSQGGAHAGYISKQFALDRVIFFSSPAGNSPWITASGPTEPERYYGFTNVKDGVIPWIIIRKNWLGLHMDDFGETVDIDQSAPPFNHSHMLTTNVEGGGLLPYHNVTVLDYSTPVDDDGQPLFLDVWQYLCFQ